MPVRRWTLKAVAAAFYASVLTLLVYSLSLHVRLDPATERVQTPQAAWASSAGACAEERGLERGMCKVDAKIDATRAKIKRHVGKRRLQAVNSIAEGSAAERSDPALGFVGDTLVWSVDRGAARIRGAVAERGLYRADGPSPAASSSVLADGQLPSR